MNNNNSNPDCVAISINNSDISYPPNSKLFCNLCSCSLSLLDPREEEWFCKRCGVSYFPNKGEKVKRANKFETPGDKPDIPPISTVDDSAYTQLRPRRPGFPKSLESLKRGGVNITGFTSTVDNESI